MMIGFVFLFCLLFRWGVLYRVLLVVRWCQVLYSSGFLSVSSHYLILPGVGSLVVYGLGVSASTPNAQGLIFSLSSLQSALLSQGHTSLMHMSGSLLSRSQMHSATCCFSLHVQFCQTIKITVRLALSTYSFSRRDLTHQNIRLHWASHWPCDVSRSTITITEPIIWKKPHKHLISHDPFCYLLIRILKHLEICEVKDERKLKIC